MCVHGQPWFFGIDNLERVILVAASTSSATTADTLDHLLLLKLRFWHSAYTRGIKVGLLGLDTTKTAQLHSQFGLVKRRMRPEGQDSFHRHTFSYPCFFHLAMRFASA